MAGGYTTINGTSCQGSLRALNPATGAFLWQDCLTTGHVLGAVTAVPGLAVVGAGPDIYAFPTASQANPLFTATGYGGANLRWSGIDLEWGAVHWGREQEPLRFCPVKCQFAAV